MLGRLQCGHVCECFSNIPDDCADKCCNCAEFLIGKCETCMHKDNLELNDPAHLNGDY